ncbi:MAG: PAS domain-containing protein [Proteobacteria bacterium]|nr:PAS domain-containing protein [Pseudomonadota bacterium]
MRFAELIFDPVQRALYLYWLNRAGDRPMPARADLDPLDMPTLALRDMGLIDVVDGGRDFHYRLVGTHNVSRMGLDITGRLASEVYQGQYRDFLMAIYREVVARRSCILSIGEFAIAGPSNLSTTRLLMPLSATGGAIDMIVYHNSSSISAPHALDPAAPRVPRRGVEKARYVRSDYL